MNKKITFRNMEHSTPMEEHAEKQLEKIMKFLENEKTPVYVDLILEPSTVHAHHRIELRVKTPNYDLISNYEGSDFYLTLNRVIDVMYNRLHEAKRKIVDSRKGIGRAEDFKRNN